MYFERLIEYSPHSLNDFSVNQIFGNCQSMAQDIHRLNGSDGAFFQMDEYQKLQVLSRFLRDLIQFWINMAWRFSRH